MTVWGKLSCKLNELIDFMDAIGSDEDKWEKLEEKIRSLWIEAKGEISE